MQLCSYGCGQEAKYQFKNGKVCCSKNFRSCPNQRQKNSIKIKEAWKDHENNLNSISCREKKSNTMKKIHRDPNSKFNLNSFKEKISINMKNVHKDLNSKFNSKSYKEKQSNIMKEKRKNPDSIFNSILYKGNQLTIEKINKKYPFFSKIEEMRYNPNKPGEKEIQVRCKNHKCENSKEKGGWFTPSFNQIQNRKNQLENNDGWDGSYFYCSQYCKDTCSLYNVHNDPYRVVNKPYTSTEKEVFNKHILKRDNEICYYCGEHHATIVHHLRPQKLEPFFALDPDYAISVCTKCHYKYCHQAGSKHSTGNLAKIVCSVESQKFLDQK